MPPSLVAVCLAAALVACGPASPDASTPSPDGGVSADPSPGAQPPASGAPSAAAPSSPAAAQPMVPLLAQQTSGFTEPMEMALRDRAALAEAWRVLHEGVPGNDPPTVDLDARTVLLVAAGQRGTGGYDVRIDEVARSGDDATVRYTVTQPGAGCMVTQMMTSPVVAVSVPRIAGDVRFERREATRGC